MLAIARALVADNSLLLIDEPSEGLAPVLIEHMMEAIRQLSASTTVLLVEQNARAALRLADYGYVLETGTVALQGQASELLHAPRVRQAYLGERA